MACSEAKAALPCLRSGGGAAALFAALALVCAWLLAAAPGNAADAGLVLEQAEFLWTDQRLPPDDDAGWQAVRLPDNWHLSRPDFAGTGWYRIRFELPAGPPRPKSIIVKRLNSQFQVLFVNRNFVGTGGPRGRAEVRVQSRPERYAIAPALLRPGANVIHIRVEADARLRQGLHRLSLGDPTEVDPEFRFQFLLQVASYNMLCAAAALLGLIALAFWLREPRQPTLFWFSCAAFTWAAVYWPWFAFSSLAEYPALRDGLSFLLRFAPSAPMLVLCIRMGERRMPRFEAGIWIVTVAGLGIALLYGTQVRGALITGWSAAYLAVLAVLLLLLIRADHENRDLSFWLLLAAVVGSVLFDAHDLARWLGWIDFDAPTLSPFQVPMLLFALGARIISRHFRAIDEVERSRVELETRVAEKAREIEAHHARLREVERTEALAGERQRIMTDMHDGVGSSLVGLLGAVQSRAVDRDEIERRLAEALQELRLTIDALEPVNGDLGAVLGSVRHRMRPAIENSGVTFDWRVGELPRLGYLTPQVVLQIQRIVLESLSNALRHARARTVRVATAVDEAAGLLEIRIDDDGNGFEAGSTCEGRGLVSMRHRAARVGGGLEVKSQSDGTSVTLRLPLNGGAAARSGAPAEPGRVSESAVPAAR